ncbi:helix-turn-helix transcriptional regulator, partial [Micromonospora sp. NPDC023814]|uniref:response regulator transcription factor n=1 Tax=Micromonospora sp. NPDC023814 TaxID=3154596 RepID=UPI0033CB85B1
RPRCGSTNQQLNPQIYRTPDHENVSLDLTGSEAYTAPSLAGALAGDRSAHRPVLSARETEVLIQWFQSQSKEFVAQRLGISLSTVNSHLEHIRIKYAMRGRAAPTKAMLVARAIQDGLIQLDDL